MDVVVKEFRRRAQTSVVKFDVAFDAGILCLGVSGGENDERDNQIGQMGQM
jgi:hypothetical protein